MESTLLGEGVPVPEKESEHRPEVLTMCTRSFSKGDGVVYIY